MAWSENPVDAIPRHEGMAALQFIADTTSPVLFSFALDWDARILELTFSEAVDALRVRIQAITIQVRAEHR